MKTTFIESLEILNEMLQDANIPVFSVNEAKDWNIQGGETYNELKQIVLDLKNEMHTAKCEAKNAWRYEH